MGSHGVPSYEWVGQGWRGSILVGPRLGKPLWENVVGGFASAKHGSVMAAGVLGLYPGVDTTTLASTGELSVVPATWDRRRTAERLPTGRETSAMFGAPGPMHPAYVRVHPCDVSDVTVGGRSVGAVMGFSSL